MLKIGITGGIGSGKSIVCSVFRTFGIPVYNADERARYLTEKNIDIRQQIIKLFGTDAYSSEGYNRKYIAFMVFNNKNLLKQLNAIIHPIVSKDFDTWIYKYQDAPYIIEEAAILFESGANKKLDYAIFVDSPLKLRITRVIARDKTNRENVLKRIKQQWPAGKIKQLADWSIINNNKQLILPQILKIHNRLINLVH